MGADTSEHKMEREHCLKTWPSAWDEVASGAKKFEFRRNDRDFAVGDILHLQKYDPYKRMYEYDRFLANADGSPRLNTKPRTITVVVTSILHGGRFGVPDGFCVMSIAPHAPTQEGR